MSEAWPTPPVATRLEGAAGGVGGGGGAGGPAPVMTTLSNTPLARVPSLWLVTARPTSRLLGMGMFWVAPTVLKVVPSVDTQAVKLSPTRVTRSQEGMTLLPEE